VKEKEHVLKHVPKGPKHTADEHGHGGGGGMKNSDKTSVSWVLKTFTILDTPHPIHIARDIQ
jgi:hypothetical protein